MIDRMTLQWVDKQLAEVEQGARELALQYDPDTTTERHTALNAGLLRGIQDARAYLQAKAKEQRNSGVPGE